MPKISHNMRLVGFLILIIAYSILANYTLQSQQHASIGALIALMPLILTCIALAINAKQRLLMFSILLISSLSLWLVWAHLTKHYDWIYWLIHESLQLILLMTFARTLKRGQQPLCTQFARIIHGELSPALISYTRKVTIAWVLFFAIVSIISTWIFFFYPVNIWSIFSNFVYLPLVIIMFGAEYMVRLRSLPKSDRTNIMDAIHAFMEQSKR